MHQFMSFHCPVIGYSQTPKWNLFNSTVAGVNMANSREVGRSGRRGWITLCIKICYSQSTGAENWDASSSVAENSRVLRKALQDFPELAIKKLFLNFVFIEHDHWEKFVKKSLGFRMARLVDFVQMALLYLLPLANCYFRLENNWNAFLQYLCTQIPFHIVTRDLCNLVSLTFWKKPWV